MTIKYEMDDVGVHAIGLNHGTLTAVTQLDEEYGLGFASSQLLVSSLAGCSGLTLRQILKKMRKSYSCVSITAEMERNDQKRKRIEVVHLNFIITSNDIDDDLAAKLAELVHNNCPMIQSVCDAIDVRENFKVQPAAETAEA